MPTDSDAYQGKQPPNPSNSNIGGRLFLIALGLTVAAMGGVFVWLMGRSFLRAYSMREWPEVGCVILASDVQERRHDPDSPTEFRQDLSFGYEWKGAAYTSDHLTLRGSPWSSNREEIESRASQYTAGMTTTCRVNPADPTLAVLKTDSLAPGYSIWFPGLFVVGGLGIALRAALGKKTPPD